LIMFLHFVNTTTLLVLCAVFVKILKPVFISGLVVSLFASTLWLKLFSFAHVNYLLRVVGKEDKSNEQYKTTDEEPKTTYPNNLTIKNIYYFIAVPALCYQLDYPRSSKIRFKGYLIRKFVVGILLSGVVFIIGNQHLYPHVVSSLSHIDNTNYIKVAEIILKLSIPNLYLWVLGFYVLFDIFLNILGELTRFGDRKFYGDWWNAQSLQYYWNNWNLPVHYFIKRHIYFPVMEKFQSRFVSLIISFTISAFFHEYVLSVPLGKVKFWAFFGILGQVPLVALTELIQHHHYTGNIIFWFSIVLGQPFIIMMYYRDFVKNFYPS